MIPLTGDCYRGVTIESFCLCLLVLLEIYEKEHMRLQLELSVNAVVVSKRVLLF